MQSDQLIDDLLRLQTRYPELLWRLRAAPGGIDIEFFLEELAMDCAVELQKAPITTAKPSDKGVTAVYSPERARVVCLGFSPSLLAETHKGIIETLEIFLQRHHSPHS